MEFIRTLSFGEKTFFFLLIIGFIILLLYYFVNKYFVLKKKKQFSNVLFNNSDYIKNISIEEIFILTSNLTRLYILYLIEMKIFGKKTILVFKYGEDSPPYIYPNLTFNNFILITKVFHNWLIFNLSFFLYSISFWIVIILLDYYDFF